MDEYSAKKSSDGLFLSRKGSNLVLRDSANNRDPNAQFCNRIGCNGRMNTAKGTQFSYQEKAKSSRAPFRSSPNGKELASSSSRTSNVPTNPKKSFPGPRKKPASESGSLPDVPEVLEVVVSEKTEKGAPFESDSAGTSESRSTEIGSSSTRSRRNFYQKPGIGNSPVSSSVKNSNQQTRSNGSGYIRNLKCSSITDALPTSDSRQKGTVKRRISEGESSNSAKGKKTGGPPFEGRNPSSGSGISISESRRTKSGIGNSSPNNDNATATMRARRPFSYTRSRVANQASRIRSSGIESRPENPQSSQPVMPMDSSSSSSSPLSRSRLGFSNENLQIFRPSSPAEVASVRSPMSFRRNNMYGIAEVLLALERIEQDEELTYEQLLVLETGLFLNGLNFYDQHRDMRLDIDNMSYEELLALEERMGTVSTALTEEALSGFVKSINYDLASPKDKDDVKCSVCQEEYVIGDELGVLQCEHKYHLCCIHQWLRLKNWCPICKAPAAPNSSLSK